MNTRPRLLLGTFVSASSKRTNKKKPPTHYEILKVDSRATQGEIKSAYFKLSKECHPDRNSSEAATAQFRDIAEAYEVLGSYQSRKIYDRSMLTRTRYTAPIGPSKPVDPKIKYYQAQAAVFRSTQKSGSTPVYDFDSWTKAHYGRTFQRTMKNVQYSRRRKELQREDNDSQLSPDEFKVGFVAVAIVLLIILVSGHIGSDDEPSYIVNQRNSLKENDSSSVKSNKADVETEFLSTK